MPNITYQLYYLFYLVLEKSIEVVLLFQNMHIPPQYSPAICQPGCRCKKGYVLDAHTKKCIKPVDCPCHHGGKSYGEGDIIQEDCNTWCVKFLI